MSARREHRLRNLERRVAELETIAATPVFIHTKGASPSPMTRPRRSPTFPAWRTATASGTLMGM